MNNHQEIEIKLKVENPDEVFKRALELGGEELKDKEGLETDIMYDDGKGFFDDFKVLRVRTAPFGNLLTYKEKNRDSDQDAFLVRTEIETFVDDAEAIKKIIEKLGFVPHRTKQKQVRQIKLDNLVIEFHKLPFIGEFIEIEGPKDEVTTLTQKLGLDALRGINIDYTSLFHKFCDEHGLPRETPQTFDQENVHFQKS